MSTYTPIASVTLSAATSSVTFSNIPQNYTDLVCVVTGTQDSTYTIRSTGFQFNGDTGNNYSGTEVFGDGSSTGSGRQTNINNAYGSVVNSSVNTTSGARYMEVHHILNYSNSTINKTTLVRGGNSAVFTSGGNNVGNGWAHARVNLWRNTAPITSMTIYAVAPNQAGAGANWNIGSTFNLYGVANASITNTAKATGGDSVYTDGTYWYHIFRSSGVFTPTRNLTADYLVVAGGGGGGWDASGGGGAGGMRCTVTGTGGGGSLESALSLTATNYTVTIGAGGAASSTVNNNGISGSNSVFATITSTGGGGGASGQVLNGSSGGSGGGAANPGTGGAASPSGQGYAGGNANDVARGGGGGGAGAAGEESQTNRAGNGGNGVATSISGSSVTYAGGGGGGSSWAGDGAASGGTGGGGSGAVRNGVGANAGTTNTGGGGGGGSNNTGAAAGGSGIVIVRYSAV